MARRNAGKELAGLGVLILIGAVVFAISKVVDSIGFTTAVVAAIMVIFGMVWLKIAKRAKRLAYLRGKYGDESVVQRIMYGTLSDCPHQWTTTCLKRESVRSGSTIHTAEAAIVCGSRSTMMWSSKSRRSVTSDGTAGLSHYS
jgi:hypothetical protein